VAQPAGCSHTCEGACHSTSQYLTQKSEILHSKISFSVRRLNCRTAHPREPRHLGGNTFVYVWSAKAPTCLELAAQPYDCLQTPRYSNERQYAVIKHAYNVVAALLILSQWQPQKPRQLNASVRTRLKQLAAWHWERLPGHSIYYPSAIITGSTNNILKNAAKSALMHNNAHRMLQHSG
jgi:hypothetical protein